MVNFIKGFISVCIKLAVVVSIAFVALLFATKKVVIKSYTNNYEAVGDYMYMEMSGYEGQVIGDSNVCMYLKME